MGAGKNPIFPLVSEGILDYAEGKGEVVNMSLLLAEQHQHAISQLAAYRVEGKISAVKGLLAECVGLNAHLKVGSRCKVQRHNLSEVITEVVGFQGEAALLMPFHTLEGVGPGARVEMIGRDAAVRPCDAWLGRVVNALGEPIDDSGLLPHGTNDCMLRASPPPAHRRSRVHGKLDLGVKAINSFLTTCNGQRMGIFAGSGVGKSILLSMLARYASADINVIGLIGERSREVQEFIQDDLGEEGLARSVLVVATSSESALMRRQAAYLTLTVAEHFRAQGKQVLCLMDSVTRFAMAQREIGLSAGEPPTTKGYPPSAFAELPMLLERAGPGEAGEGSITGLFTVLVEGDDDNEPISDAVRGILDGHIVLSRGIAQRGRYPSIDILKSVSRMLPDCNDAAENNLIQAARSVLATYEDMAEMIRLGAYRRGSDREVDRAIDLFPKLDAFLRQQQDQSHTVAESYDLLAAAMGFENWRNLLGGSARTEAAT